MQIWTICFAYLFAILLIIGGFISLYLGYRMIRYRSATAEANHTFTGRIGNMEFSIGAGSLAALALAVSILWAGAAVLARPRVSFELASDIKDAGGLRFLTQVRVTDPHRLGVEERATVARLAELLSNQEREVAAMRAYEDSAYAAADAAASAASEAADSAAEAADSAAEAEDR